MAAPPLPYSLCVIRLATPVTEQQDNLLDVEQKAIIIRPIVIMIYIKFCLLMFYLKFSSLALISTASGFFFFQTCGNRQVFAAAREGLFPEIMAMLNITYYTPIPAIFTALIGLVYLVEDSVISLIRYLVFVEMVFDTMTVAVLPYFRWKQPNRHRPFKVHFDASEVDTYTTLNQCKICENRKRCLEGERTVCKFSSTLPKSRVALTVGGTIGEGSGRIPRRKQNNLHFMIIHFANVRHYFYALIFFLVCVY